MPPSRPATPHPSTAPAGPGDHRARHGPARAPAATAAGPATLPPLIHPQQRGAGFFYLVAVMDWATRHVLAWRLSNTMDASFRVQALDDALGWRAPEILNTDSEYVRAGSPRWFDSNTD